MSIARYLDRKGGYPVMTMIFTLSLPLLTASLILFAKKLLTRGSGSGCGTSIGDDDSERSDWADNSSSSSSLRVGVDDSGGGAAGVYNTTTTPNSIAANSNSNFGNSRSSSNNISVNSNSNNGSSVNSSSSMLPVFLRVSSSSGNQMSEDVNFDDGIMSADKKLLTWSSLGLEQPLVMAMVGLPARGKSHISKMILRYLTWNGFECKNFNVGEQRRKEGHASEKAQFFDPNNTKAKELREKLAADVQLEMYHWLRAQSSKKRAAIFDATNTTKNRRLLLMEMAQKENVYLLFIESMCDDPNILRRNYLRKTKNDDYKYMSKDEALRDFQKRVEIYDQQYETIDDSEPNGSCTISYIKLINVGQKVITNRCNGYLPSQVAFYLRNAHIEPRKIYLCLNSEYQNMHIKRVWDDDKEPPVLTEDGQMFSINLAKFFKNRAEVEDSVESDGEQDFLSSPREDDEDEGSQISARRRREQMFILSGTSTLEKETTTHLRVMHDVFKCFNTPILNELRAGDCQGLSIEEFNKKYPKEYSKRQSNKLVYRYPGIGGESYIDVIERLKPIIIELERQKRNILIVCKMAVMRCIYGYFMHIPIEKIPYLQFELHRLYELSPSDVKCNVLDIDDGERLVLPSDMEP